MTSEYQLIQLYCVICHHYNTRLVYDAQRLSNNFRPKFTDEECITIVLWGIANRKFKLKDAYNFILGYYKSWFPELPGYKAFNKRACFLADAIKSLADGLLQELPCHYPKTTHLLDSMPVVVAKQSRSQRAKAASDLCDKGYCDSKNMYYYGVKLHVLGQNQYSSIPTPKQVLLTSASVHDRKAAQEMLFDVYDTNIFADKAYKNADWEAQIHANNRIRLVTPVKLQKGQKRLESAQRLYSTAVSSVRQPIESFFNWIQEKTYIQNACKVRSNNGLISFIFARIAVCCLIICKVLSV